MDEVIRLSTPVVRTRPVISGVELATVSSHVEPFLAFATDLTQRGLLSGADEAELAHCHAQLAGELRNPAGAADVVVRRYLANMLDIVRRYLDLEAVFGPEADAAPAGIRNALDNVSQHPDELSDESAVRLAADTAETLAQELPTGDATSLDVWKIAKKVAWFGTVPAVGALTASAAGAKLASDVGSAALWGLTPPWAAIIGAILGFLATFAIQVNREK